MQSINWNKYYIVQLETINGNVLHVSGSLVEDGLASGKVTEKDHSLKIEPPPSVDEMTTIVPNILYCENLEKEVYNK